MNPCIVLHKQSALLTYEEALHEARARVAAGLGEHEVYELRAAVLSPSEMWVVGLGEMWC